MQSDYDMQSVISGFTVEMELYPHMLTIVWAPESLLECLDCIYINATSVNNINQTIDLSNYFYTWLWFNS